MVPVHGSPQSPCFPQCVEWILQNQQEDGSWGQPGAVNKDALLSTLACVLALNTWNVGPDHIRRVPAIYPDNVYSRLCMVDTLEKMGISSEFACEIQDILDMTYRCWMQNEEEIMSDMGLCAKAFRLLRMHGYNITSDGMAQFAEQSSFDNSIHVYLNDIEPLRELYKSSQVRFSEDDLILENIGSWSTKLLKQQLSSKNISKYLLTEVTHALKFPLYATLEPHEHRRNIERFKTNVFQLLKSGYWY
uniref:Terpene synthase N-terminal domain-containing protein n=1 Tax=Oryza nivara TaxID=4536 RepID=A0A0E0HFB1_ORYNI